MPDAYKGIEFSTIKAWVEEGIAFMQFNRIRAFNSINEEVLDEATRLLDMYSADPDVRVIIICGGSRAFAAGADIASVTEYNPFQARSFLDKAHRCLFAIEDNPKPTIAAVRGLALGGGLEVVMACDIHIIAENATLGLPEIDRGIFPGAGGTQRFPRISAINIVKEYIFTGEFFNGEVAKRIGLANHVVPSDQVMETAVKIARKIARKSPLALREAKNAINMSMNTDIKTGCRIEQIGWSMLFSSEDQKEGMRAFAESRQPDFTGR